MAYLDGELDAARAASLASHLEHCGECGALAAQFRGLSERLLDFPVEATPVNLNAAVLGALESSEPKKPVRPDVDELVWSKLQRLGRSPAAWALTAAAVIVLVVVGVHQFFAPPARFDRVELGASMDRPSNSAVPANSVSASRGAARSAAEVPESLEQEHPRVPKTGLTISEGTAGGSLEAPEAAGPMIAQTVSFTIVATNYDEASAAIDRLAGAHGGYVQKLTAEARAGAPRELSVTLRVPAAQFADTIAQLRKLGHVEQETRANDEVTDPYVDLQARLKSARATEQRLLQLLATRTGKLEDVLAVEQELARIRQEIESMDGQRTVLLHRVNYVTVDVGLREEYHEQMHPAATSTTLGLRNALVEGLNNLVEGVVSLLVFLFAYGPSILFWCAVILVPGFFIWRWSRSRARD